MSREKKPPYADGLKELTAEGLNALRADLYRDESGCQSDLMTIRIKLQIINKEKVRRMVEAMNPYGPREKAIGIARLKANPRSDELLVEKLRLVHISSGVDEDVYPEVGYDGVEILVTAGDRKGFADYRFRGFGPDEPWIHPVLEDWALHHRCYWEWVTETSIRLCKWANYDFGRNPPQP